MFDLISIEVGKIWIVFPRASKTGRENLIVIYKIMSGIDKIDRQSLYVCQLRDTLR